MKYPAMLACALLVSSPAAFAITDLDLDPGFGTNGTFIADFTDAQGSYDIGIQSFRECDRTSDGLCDFPVSFHYYVAGFHNHLGTQDMVVTLISDTGIPAASFGNGGKLTIPTSMTSINDVAFDPVTDRLYFAGSQRLFSTTSLEFAVTCLDLLTRAPCTDFGNVGATELIAFDLGGTDNDVANRVLFDPQGYLYVAGYADTPNGNQIAVAKLSTADGALVTAFGTNGQAHFVLGSRPTGQSTSASGMALIPSSFSGIPLDKLYIAGAYKTLFDDIDGYVLMIDAIGGTYVNTRTISYENDNPISNPHGNDAVSAITVLANGELAVAGYSDTTTADQPALLLAKMHADSSLALDAGFCGTGLCVKQVGEGPHGWQDTLPTAIGERPNTRDLVVGIRAGTWHLDFVTSRWVLSQKQVVQQYSADGGALHAQTEIQFPAADPSTTDVRSAGMNVDNGIVELTGSRALATDPDDFDITLTRMLANDTIFASQFGGSQSD
jgi:hypothetical protein